MELRQGFVAFARQEGSNVAALCRRFGISRKTGSKWLARAAHGETPLTDRSRRPHPAGGGSSGAGQARRPPGLGRKQVAPGAAPAPSTIIAILRRAGQLAPEPPPRDFLRFEHSAPNELWQLDFMGHRALDADRVHPMTVLDDHSRFALALAACANEQHHTVQDRLTTVFRRFGLPRFLLTDNGAPWAPAGEATGLTRLEAWWLHLGIEPWHGQPSHPQTHGKIERFHGTIAAEIFVRRQFPDLAAAQTAFDAFRAAYNHARPHEALDHAVPADRYQPSPRPFPETLQEIIYAPDDTVRLVNVHGSVSWQGRRA
ncbi:MAG: integrase core domain-containing protein, partial [Chloroflexota bacterium]|nr:integrase core domain-containing protein [Chloroflexota bacterium]